MGSSCALEYSVEGCVCFKGKFSGGHYYFLAKRGDQWYKLDDATCEILTVEAVQEQVSQYGRQVLLHTTSCSPAAEKGCSAGKDMGGGG